MGERETERVREDCMKPITGGFKRKTHENLYRTPAIIEVGS